MIQSPRNDSILTNRSYHLTCTVTGAPFPEVTWIKDGVELNYTSRIYTSLYNASLTITNVELTDDGVYQCVVDNERGTDSSLEATLVVQGNDGTSVMQFILMISRVNLF